MNLPVKLCLAPMAGVTDRAFRELAMEYGATLCTTEMISIKGLYYNDKKTADLLENGEREHPIAIQLFGHEPEIFRETVPKALSFGGDYIDINCGCPAKKIISNSDGSALMKTPELIGEIVKAVTDSCNVPVGVKMRLGWDENSINAVQCAKVAENSGASYITVHGRTTKQNYSGQCNYGEIAKVVKSVNIPVIANGDIKSPCDAQRVIEQTGCAGIMVGRATLGNLHLIKEIADFLEKGLGIPKQSNNEKLLLAKRHIGLIVKYKGEQNGIKEARKHALWYVKGMPNNVKYKDMLVRCKTYNEMCEIFNELNKICEDV